MSTEFIDIFPMIFCMLEMSKNGRIFHDLADSAEAERDALKDSPVLGEHGEPHSHRRRSGRSGALRVRGSMSSSRPSAGCPVEGERAMACAFVAGVH
ncbi:hypothetical protein [Streptosporangium sp. 'caverna']|uniref:hypothetical protein n=1 Tax=Streptosporangium sp. 'caverna' TaxID=2202249 RepID=UPI0013A6C1EB|nr:hypothetical protein [Streptosporangium sp. 'caverna']